MDVLNSYQYSPDRGCRRLLDNIGWHSGNRKEANEVFGYLFNDRGVLDIVYLGRQIPRAAITAPAGPDPRGGRADLTAVLGSLYFLSWGYISMFLLDVQLSTHQSARVK